MSVRLTVELESKLAKKLPRAGAEESSCLDTQTVVKSAQESPQGTAEEANSR
jgi:hypothetical protein